MQGMSGNKCNGFAKLVQEALSKARWFLEPELNIQTNTLWHSTNSGAAATAKSFSDALLCQGFASSVAAAAFGSAAAFAYGAGFGRV